MKSYKIISSFNNGKRIVRMDEALEFTNVLEERLAVHGNVIDKLSDGFRYLFFYLFGYKQTNWVKKQFSPFLYFLYT